MDLANSIAKGVLTGALGLIGLRKTSRALTRGHTSAVTDISVDPNGTFLCSCDKDGKVKAWMVSYGYVVLQESLGDGSSASSVLACRPIVDVSSTGVDLVVFAAGQNNETKGVVCCWEASRSSGMWVGQTKVEQLFCFHGESGAITHLALMPGERLAAASADGLLWIADLRKRKLGSGINDVILPSVNFSSVTAMIIVRQRFPETSKIVLGSETGRISIWNDDRLQPSTEQADTLFVHQGKEADQTTTQLSQLSSKKFNLMSLGSVNTSSKYRIYPVASSDSRRGRRRKRRASLRRGLNHDTLQQKNPPMCTYWAHGKRALQGGGISAFAVTRWIDEDGANLLFSASGDTTVKMWWLGKPDLLATFRGHKAAVTKLTILRSSSDGEAPELFSASNDTTIMHWSINAKEPEKCTCLKIYRGHDSIINDLMLVDIPDVDLISADETKPFKRMDIEKDSKAPLIRKDSMLHTHYLITSSRDGTVRAWHMTRGNSPDEHAKIVKTVYRSTNGLTKLLPHQTDRLDIDAGIETHNLRSSWTDRGSTRRQNAADTNVIVACNSGRIAYIDLFPSPQLKLTFRSATAYEICSPILDWATFMYQKTRLVLPTVTLCLALLKMSDESGEQKVLHRAAVEDAMEKALSRKGLSGLLVGLSMVTKESGFLIEHIVLVSFALVVIILMSCKVYKRLDKCHKHVMKNEEYIEEISTFTQAKARDQQPAHRLASFLQQTMDLVYVFLWGTVKVLTVPILTHMYSCIDCPILEDGKRHLSLDHNVLCWQGAHLYYAGISMFVALGYVFFVVPFTFVGSNIRVYSDSDGICNGVEELRRNSAITACSVHLAFLTPIGINWSTNQLMEFIVKALLPAAAILQNQHHVLRCSMITAVLAVETIVAIRWPAYSDKRASFLYSSLKFSLLYVSMCTLYGGYHADRLEAAPGLVVAIIAGLGVILIAVICRIVIPDKYAAKVDCCSGSNEHSTNYKGVDDEESNIIP